MLSMDWWSLRFFNVYGNGEDHKGKMASMVSQSIDQINKTGTVKLFKHGEQKRDFVYVKDVVRVIKWIIENRPDKGIYDVGSGVAQSFNTMAHTVATLLGKELEIEYINMPDLDFYQTFTQADLTKLRRVGYPTPMHRLEQGISDML